MTDDPSCVRAGIEMTKSEWFALPIAVRQAYWKDTDWGKQAASPQMIETIRECLSRMSSSR